MISTQTCIATFVCDSTDTAIYQLARNFSSSHPEQFASVKEQLASYSSVSHTR